MLSFLSYINITMKILFLCTAHNSLSQRLYLALSATHDLTIEYALSEEVMTSAVALATPDLIICPFLTSLVPKQIYDSYLTLIIHPGPPGDAGPSALDWVLMGDDGTFDDANEVLKSLDTRDCRQGRTHWGITVLQAIEEFDAGPVWAFDQFSIDIDQPGLTKSDLYRGPVTRAALSATQAAIRRIEDSAIISRMPDLATGNSKRDHSPPPTAGKYTPHLKARAEYGLLAVSDCQAFQGGKTHHRPLLKAAQRDFDVTRHGSQQISRRIRCGDSQPGVLSKVFGASLYLYGGLVDDNVGGLHPSLLSNSGVNILGTRDEAICIATCNGKGVWITHVRRPKGKTDAALWPKVPATTGLIDLGLLTANKVAQLHWSAPSAWELGPFKTYQEVWVDFIIDSNFNKIAYLYFNFYNGAMSTAKCSQLIECMEYILATSTSSSPTRAVVLMGGAYFSNGIALNVIEASPDPALESWLNINRIDDVVHFLLSAFPQRDILTVAAVRGNAAAGGVALAAACDVVIASADVVLNPAYRAVGLYGSEYHTLSYYGRCGEGKAKSILRAMMPMSPHQAKAIGLVDVVFTSTGEVLEAKIRKHVSGLIKPGGEFLRGLWKSRVDVSEPALARARAMELREMVLDFWSARSVRYHSRRFDFVRKVKPAATPLRFATHRRIIDGEGDEEERDSFDDVSYYERLEKERIQAQLRIEIRAEVPVETKATSEQEHDTRRDSGTDVSMDEPATSLTAISHGLPTPVVFNEARRGSDAFPLSTRTPSESEKQRRASLVMPVAEKLIETVFECYYKPETEPLSPPLTPEVVKPPVRPWGATDLRQAGCVNGS